AIPHRSVYVHQIVCRSKRACRRPLLPAHPSPSTFAEKCHAGAVMLSAARPRDEGPLKECNDESLRSWPQSTSIIFSTLEHSVQRRAQALQLPASPGGTCARCPEESASWPVLRKT